MATIDTDFDSFSDEIQYDSVSDEYESDDYFQRRDFENWTDSDYEIELAQPRTLFGLCVRVVKKVFPSQVIATYLPRPLVDKILLRLFVKLPSGWYYSKKCNFIALNFEEINKDEIKSIIDRMSNRSDWPELVSVYGRWNRYVHYTPCDNYSTKMAVHVFLHDMNMYLSPVTDRPFLFKACDICDCICFASHRYVEIPPETDYSVISSYLELSEINC
nr:Xecn 66 [Mamestra configurata nucleopolyhedrovirus A]